MKKTLISIAVGLGFLVPVLVWAQTSTTGLLTVYVQVQNQSGFNYSPSNFNVSVSGQNPSPSSFAGSLQGTLVSLNPGSYSVTITNAMSNYSPTYSAGCNGTIAAGATQTCVITISGGQYYGGNPTPYPYPYSAAPQLTCRTDTPTVGLGQAARFTAIGGVGGTYNWYANGQNFPNSGPVLTTTFSGSGTQTVQVTNAAQTATCVVTVTTNYYPQPMPTPTYPAAPQYPNYTYPTYQSGYPYAYPTITSVAYPRLPNAGFAPLESAQLAFAVVLLMGAGIAAFPYARKAFALAVR